MIAFWAACLLCRRPLHAMAYLLRIASGGSETPAACQGQWKLAIGPRRTIRLRSGIDVVADRRRDRLRLRGCHFSGLAAIVTAVIIGARFHRGWCYLTNGLQLSGGPLIAEVMLGSNLEFNCDVDSGCGSKS